MATPNTNLKVTIGAELRDIKSALATLRGDLKNTQKVASNVNFAGITTGLKSFLGAVGGLGTLVVGIRAIATATIEAEKAQAQLNAVIKSTGGVAGVTAKSANDLADSLQAITTYDDEAIIGAETLLLRFKNIGQEVFPQATKAVLNMSSALGTDLESSVTKIGKALQDPVNGMTALGKAGVKLTEDQKELVKQLVETGRMAEAQAIILKELERAYGGSAEAARNTLGGALEGLKNDFENLLEGDSGSDGIRGTTAAINDLAKVMRSPATKSAFASITNDLADMTSVAAQAIVTLVALSNKVGGFGAGGLVGSGFGPSGLAAAIPGALRKYFMPEAPLPIDGNRRRGGRPFAADAPGTSQTYIDAAAEAEAAAAKKAAEAAKKASEDAAKSSATSSRKAASDRVSAEKEAAEEIAKIRQQEADDIADRNKRIATGMADVNIELLRQTGQAAEAAFAEIDAKYAALLADLQAKGDSDGEATLRKLIGLEKADVTLAAFKDKVRAVMDELRAETDFINSQQQIPGGLTATDAELALQAARDKTLAQLRAIREEGALAWNQKPTPETIAALKELDATIGQVQQSTDDFSRGVKDGAVQSLSTFFTDLATGAKSFKDAFKDMLASFLSGIAQMIAQKLALKAVDAIAGGFGFHGGGLVGGGGSFRREVSASVFAGAPRFHSGSGGAIGDLKAGEVPAILLTGERVLSRSETAKYSQGQRPAPGTRIVNVFDPSFVPDQMDSAAGEKVILNVIGRNPGRIQSMLR